MAGTNLHSLREDCAYSPDSFHTLFPTWGSIIRHNETPPPRAGLNGCRPHTIIGWSLRIFLSRLRKPLAVIQPDLYRRAPESILAVPIHAACRIIHHRQMAMQLRMPLHRPKKPSQPLPPPVPPCLSLSLKMPQQPLPLSLSIMVWKPFRLRWPNP